MRDQLAPYVWREGMAWGWRGRTSIELLAVSVDILRRVKVGFEPKLHSRPR